MKSLDKHNKEMMDVYNMVYPRLTDIACPKCGAELFDVEIELALTSNPPKKRVSCAQCGYEGYMIV